MITKGFLETIERNPASYLVRLVHSEVKENTKVMLLVNVCPDEMRTEESLDMLELSKEMKMFRPGIDYFKDVTI